MDTVTLHLDGMTFKPHGEPIEVVPFKPLMTVKDALLTAGFPIRGLDFYLAFCDEQILDLDASINPGDEVHILMPLGGG